MDTFTMCVSLNGISSVWADVRGSDVNVHGMGSCWLHFELVNKKVNVFNHYFAIVHCRNPRVGSWPHPSDHTTSVPTSAQKSTAVERFFSADRKREARPCNCDRLAIAIVLQSTTCKRRAENADTPHRWGVPAKMAGLPKWHLPKWHLPKWHLPKWQVKL